MKQLPTKIGHNLWRRYCDMRPSNRATGHCARPLAVNVVVRDFCAEQKLRHSIGLRRESNEGLRKFPRYFPALMKCIIPHALFQHVPCATHSVSMPQAASRSIPSRTTLSGINSSFMQSIRWTAANEKQTTVCI